LQHNPAVEFLTRILLFTPGLKPHFINDRIPRAKARGFHLAALAHGEK
jgi:hypothetical protein